MKKLLLVVLICSFTAIGFCNITTDLNPPLPLCAALKAVIKEQPTAFENIKGAYISENTDGSKNYASKVVFEGWASNRYGTTDDGPSIDIKSELTTKAKATELFKTTEKQITECLGVEGLAVKAEGIDQFLIFTKDNCDVALIMVSKEGKTYVMISVSKAS